MTTKPTHTPLPWEIDDNLIYRLNKEGSNEVTLSIQTTPRNKIAEHAIALTFVRCVNAHEELLAVVKMLHCTYGPEHEGSERCRICKAIAKAEGLDK